MPRWGRGPFDWGIGGPLASAGFGPEHAAFVVEDLNRQPGLRTRVRLSPFSAALWQQAASPSFSSEGHTTYVLDLSGGFQRVWTSCLRGSVRRAVRNAEPAGLEIQVDHTGRLIPVFYQRCEQSIQRGTRPAGEPLPLARMRAHRANP